MAANDLQEIIWITLYEDLDCVKFRCYFLSFWCVRTQSTLLHVKRHHYAIHGIRINEMEMIFALCNLYVIQFSFFIFIFCSSLCCRGYLPDLLHFTHTYAIGTYPFKSCQSPNNTNLLGFAYENIIKNQITAKLLNEPKRCLRSLLCQPIDMHTTFSLSFDCSCKFLCFWFCVSFGYMSILSSAPLSLFRSQQFTRRTSRVSISAVKRAYLKKTTKYTLFGKVFRKVIQIWVKLRKVQFKQQTSTQMQNGDVWFSKS